MKKVWARDHDETVDAHPHHVEGRNQRLPQERGLLVGHGVELDILEVKAHTSSTVALEMGFTATFLPAEWQGKTLLGLE